MQAALLNLYSLDARLAQARARAASLTAQSDDVRNQLAQARRDRTIAERAWRASVAALATHLRTMYEHSTPDAVAVLLGATSIDDAMTRLGDLQRTARMNRDTIIQTQQARRELTRLQGDLALRARRLHALVVSAQETTAELAQTRAERSTYVTALANERTFNTRKIAQLDARARASAARTPAATTTSTRAASPTVAPAELSTPSPASSGTTLVVTATGYALAGSTSTGLSTGWGVVAVDPSVIPLGTRLTIPGYGDGVAADTGGTVHGAAIDLWFPTAAQAAAWGRRTVTISLH